MNNSIGLYFLCLKLFAIEINQYGGTLKKITPPQNIPGAGSGVATLLSTPDLSLSTAEYRRFYLRISHEGLVSVGVQGSDPIQVSSGVFMNDEIYHNTKFIGVTTQEEGLWNLCSSNGMYN